MVAEPGVSELGEQADGPPLQVAGQAGPDVRRGHGRLGWRRVATHGGPSQERWCQGGRGHPSRPGRGGGAAGISARRVGEAPLPAKAVDELGHLTQSLEVKERARVARRKGYRGAPGVVRGGQGDGGMAAVGQPDDDVGALAAADADDRQLLSAERVMGMRDRHQSRRGLGGRGSALGMCRRSSTAAFRPG